MNLYFISYESSFTFGGSATTAWFVFNRFLARMSIVSFPWMPMWAGIYKNWTSTPTSMILYKDSKIFKRISCPHLDDLCLRLARTALESEHITIFIAFFKYYFWQLFKKNHTVHNTQNSLTHTYTHRELGVQVTKQIQLDQLIWSSHTYHYEGYSNNNKSIIQGNTYTHTHTHTHIHTHIHKPNQLI